MNCAYCGKDLAGLDALESIVLNKWYCSKDCIANGKQAYTSKQPFKLGEPEIGRSSGVFLASPKDAASQQGIKYDQDKLPYHLISIPALDELAKRLQHGARKYSDRNWEKGLEYNRCYRAALNHLYAFWRGEDIDQDSGLSHLSGALCNLMFLCHFESNPFYKQFDTRPVSPGKSKLP